MPPEGPLALTKAQAILMELQRDLTTNRLTNFNFVSVKLTKSELQEVITPLIKARSGAELKPLTFQDKIFIGDSMNPVFLL